MRIHKIKLSEEFVEAILSGEKKFEIRNNDRGYQKGDHVRFIVTKDGLHVAGSQAAELEAKEYVITYVISGWGLENGYVAFGISEITEQNEEWDIVEIWDKGKMSLRLRNVLLRGFGSNYGITHPSLADIVKTGRKEIMRFRNMGPHSLRELDELMRDNNLKY